MTDPELVRKKLAQVETYVADLRRLGRPEAIETDLRERRFLEHTLQIAIQAILDVAGHIVSDERLGEPPTHGEMFRLLANDGWIPEDLAEPLRRMTGFRNVLVHGYANVDPGIVAEMVRSRLDDLLAFCRSVRQRLER